MLLPNLTSSHLKIPHCPSAALSRQSISRQIASTSCCTSRQQTATSAQLRHIASAVPPFYHVPRPQRATSLWAAAASSAADITADHLADVSSDDSVLQDLLVWLVNNGVTGIGQAGSAVALYQDDDGDRGIVAVQDIPAGVQLLRVPLRLAITDVMDEEQRSQLVGQGALWQDRLVAKLLHEVHLGKKSPWYPYIRALPRHVPSALETFTASEAHQCQLPAVCQAIQSHADKMAASWQASRPDAIGGADLQTYRWAHSCVMSRTFGNAAQNGGIGVRMLVPLIDMLNHAGDETESGLLADAPVARDNVRWDVVSPQNSPNNCWEMVLSTTQSIPAQSPLLLSYFEGSNDDFLLHYGFVPASNPHDSLQLFTNITEALEHLWWQDIAQGQSPSELAPVYQQALDAGLQALQQEVAAAAAAAAGSDDSSGWGQLLEALEPIKVASGSRISNSLMAALEFLHNGDMAAVEAAVAALSWQQLQSLPTSLLQDLAILVTDGQQGDDSEAVQQYGHLLRHYAQALIPDYSPQLHQRLAAAMAAAAADQTSSSVNAAPPVTAKRKKAVPGPPAAAASSSSSSSTKGDKSFAGLTQVPVGVLVDTILSQSYQQSCVHGVHSEVQTSRPSYAVKCAVKFRLSKKMLLYDVVIAAGTTLAVLEQQQELAAKAATLRERSKQQRDDNALPWQQ